MQDNCVLANSSDHVVGAVRPVVSPMRLTLHSDDISVMVISSLNETRRGGFVDQRPAIGALVLNIDLEHRRSCVIDPNEAETFVQPSGFRLLQVHLPSDVLHPLFPSGWTMDARLNALGECMWTMMLDGATDPQFGESILRALLAHLRSRKDAAGLNSVSYGGLAPWQERLAKTMLGTNLLHPAQLGEVAARCRLSASQFTRAFRQSIGTSPHRWIVKRRIAQARAFLEDGTVSLVDIALCCGFADQSHFTRVFTREIGLPPGQWRRLHRRVPDPVDRTGNVFSTDAWREAL